MRESLLNLGNPRLCDHLLSLLRQIGNYLAILLGLRNRQSSLPIYTRFLRTGEEVIRTFLNKKKRWREQMPHERSSQVLFVPTAMPGGLNAYLFDSALQRSCSWHAAQAPQLCSPTARVVPYYGQPIRRLDIRTV